MGQDLWGRPPSPFSGVWDLYPEAVDPPRTGGTREHQSGSSLWTHRHGRPREGRSWSLGTAEPCSSLLDADPLT